MLVMVTLSGRGCFRSGGFYQQAPFPLIERVKAKVRQLGGGAKLIALAPLE